MKKFIFILTVFLGAGLLIFISFGGDILPREQTTTVDFSDEHKLYKWRDDQKKFLEVSASGSRSEADVLFLERFSPVDNIYYVSQARTPIDFKKNGAVNTVVLGAGLFICNIQTGLEEYEFQLSDLTLKPKNRGVFMVDTRGSDIKIFSFDTFLNIELVSGTKRSHATNFVLFPSLFFKHDPKNTQNLKGADMLRISLIDFIRYIDMNSPDERKILIASDENTFMNVQKDINKRFHAFKDAYNAIAESKILKNMDGTAFFDTSSIIFINESKKAVLLKNELVAEMAPFFMTTGKASEANVKNTLDAMKKLNPDLYIEGLSILKKYYYIVRFTNFINDTDTFDSLSPESPLTTLTENIIAPKKNLHQNSYYLHLSDIFSVYYFSSLNQSDLNSSLEESLQRILDNKALSQEEFLPFVFFTTQYLSSGPTIANEDTLQIIDHLFQITNEFYAQNKANGIKTTTLTSAIFYNYTKIFSKLYGVFVNTFVDKTTKGWLLKTEFIQGGSKELKISFIETFKSMINHAQRDIESKRQDFYSTGSLRLDSQVVDSYTLLQSTIKPFDTLVAMFDNYPKYLNDSHLNDSNKEAQGILVEANNEMSLKFLQDYLKKFNNVDITTLHVMNDFSKDGFYDVQVAILGNIFSFKLWEQNHMIADISLTDTFGQKKIFPNIAISLDEKEKKSETANTSMTDPLLKYRSDFKNFFEVTFLKTESSGLIPQIQSTDEDTVRDNNSPTIQLFIQKELLDKDFKNIANFLPITFKDIDASIDETGEYVIDVNNINKSFAGENSSYNVEMSGKYLFKRHAFSRLTLKIKKDGDTKSYDLNGTIIEILPARISVLTVPDLLKDIGYYLDVIRSSYANQKSIILDLIGKKVILDGVSSGVTIPTD